VVITSPKTLPEENFSGSVIFFIRITAFVNKFLPKSTRIWHIRQRVLSLC
jgi:hypothetical protein